VDAIRDGAGETLTAAERAKRYRARKRSGGVGGPARERPGPKRRPADHHAEAARAAAALAWELGWLRPEDVDERLASLLADVRLGLKRLGC